MATITSTQNGDHNDTGTWVGGVVPDDGDNVVIEHDVAVVADWTIGEQDATGTSALHVDGGELTLEDGFDMTIKGEITCADAGNIIIGAGCVWDQIVTSNDYVNVIGDQLNEACGITINGTSGSRTTFKVTSTSGSAYYTGDNRLCGRLYARYTDFENINDGLLDGIAFNVYGRSDDQALDIAECTFDANCGLVRNEIGANAPCLWKIVNCTHLGTDTNFRYLGTNNQENATEDHHFKGNVCYGKVELITSSLLVIGGPTDDEACIFLGDIQWTDGGVETATFENCFIQGDDLTIRGDMTDCIFYDDTTNPHFVNALQQREVTLEGAIFELDDSGEDGDCILGNPGNADGVPLHVRNCIIGLNSNGGVVGSLINGIGDSGITFTAEHNSFLVSTTILHGVLIGENYEGHTDMIESLKSNLAVSIDSGNGDLIVIRNDSTVVNPVLAANATHNGYYDLDTAYDPGTDGTFSGGHGANDVSTDPDLYDHTRTLATWDTLLGGPGTYANVVSELAKKNDSDYDSDYNLSDFRAYKREGFAPQNTDYEDAGHDSVTIGAVEMYSGGGGGSTVTVTTALYDQDNALVTSQSGISVSIWHGPPTGAPDEEISGLSSNGSGVISFEIESAGLSNGDPVTLVPYASWGTSNWKLGGVKFTPTYS